jgi:hypothetical protein
MADRIYVTYTPTTAPGSYHTAIHYERTDPAGNVVQHFFIEAKPEKLDQLSASDKAIGVIEEAFRNDVSRMRREKFMRRHRIAASVFDTGACSRDVLAHPGDIRRYRALETVSPWL